MLRLFLIAATIALAPAAYAADAKQMEENKKVVLQLYEAAINQKDFEAASKFLGPRYIQHNPRAADGPEGLKAFLALRTHRIRVGASRRILFAVLPQKLILRGLRESADSVTRLALARLFRNGHASVHGHDVYGVVPEPEGTLRTRRAEVHAQRKHLAVLDQTGRLGDLVRGDEVQRPELVGVSPPSPVADIAGDSAEVGQAGHSACPSSSSRATAAPILPPSTQSTWPEI